MADARTISEELHAKRQLAFERIDLEALLLKAGKEVLKLLAGVCRGCLLVPIGFQEHGVALGFAFQAQFRGRSHGCWNSINVKVGAALQ